MLDAWKDALAGDPVSAFGGVLITNGVVDKETAEEINKIFFEVIIAPDYDVDALEILGQKKNRIILVRKEAKLPKKQFRALLNGVLVQDKDTNIETVADLKTVTDKAPTPEEVEDMLFANKIVKNSKSNAIVLAKGKQLLASGVGQTSRVDALKQAIEKAKSFGFDLNGAVMASDAFFPFPDCVEIADKEGITAVIQPGGSVKMICLLLIAMSMAWRWLLPVSVILNTKIIIKNGIVLFYTRNSDGLGYSQYHHHHERENRGG